MALVAGQAGRSALPILPAGAARRLILVLLQWFVKDACLGDW